MGSPLLVDSLSFFQRRFQRSLPPCSADAHLYPLRLCAGSASRSIAACGCNRSAISRQEQLRAEPPQHRLRLRRQELPVVIALGTISLQPSYWVDQGPCCKDHDTFQRVAMVEAGPSHRRPTKRFCKDGWHQRKCRHGGPCDGMERWYCYVPYSPSRAHRPWCW